MKATGLAFTASFQAARILLEVTGIRDTEDLECNEERNAVTADNTSLCTVRQEEELPLLDRMKIMQQNQQILENLPLTLKLTNKSETISSQEL